MLYWLKQKYKQFFDWFVISEEDLSLRQTEAEPLKNNEILIKQKKNKKRKKSIQNRKYHKVVNLD